MFASNYKMNTIYAKCNVLVITFTIILVINNTYAGTKTFIIIIAHPLL